MALSSKFLRILVGINQITFNTYFRNEYFYRASVVCNCKPFFHNKKQTQRLLVKIVVWFATKPNEVVVQQIIGTIGNGTVVMQLGIQLSFCSLSFPVIFRYSLLKRLPKIVNRD
jgi:hypothetical protein